MGEALNRFRTTAAKGAPALRVREASLDDYPGIAELESRYGLETKPREEWQHLWVNNPVCRQLSKGWPIGWVLENAGREVVGYLGNIPLSCEFRGSKYLVASTRAWVVDSAYRGYSLLLLDYFFAQKGVDLFLTTSLNSEAWEGFRAFGPSPVPVGDWDHSTFWITNYSGFLSSSLRTRRIPFAKILSYPLAILPLLRDLFNWRAGASKQVHVQFCSAFDENFGTFWEELKRTHAEVLLGTRTREVLNWHFKYALLRHEVWIVSVTRASRMVAYAVFYRQDNSNFGLKRLRLADFQTVEGDEALLIPVLSAALKRCRREGIHMLEILGISPGKAQVIAEMAPYRRKLSSWLSFYKANHPQLVESLKDQKCWDLSCFDGDISL